MQDAASAIKIFVSYAHEDDEQRQGLTSHLRQIPNVAVWDDRAIPAGSEWDDDITQQLKSADIILLLISTHFLSSQYVKDVEIKVALERHAAGTAVVIPVLVKSCIWSHNLGHLQALPSDENLPEDKNWLTSDAWYSPDQAYTHVARGVMREVNRIRDLTEQQRDRQREAEETYRKKVAKMLADETISDIERDTLEELRVELELSEEDADRIEKGELRPIEERQANLVRYEKTYRREVFRSYPLSDQVQADLRKRREDLLLTDSEVAALEQGVIEEWQTAEAERIDSEREAEEAAQRQAEEEAEREAKEEAKRRAREDSEKASLAAWGTMLEDFLVSQLDSDDDIFRLRNDIPDGALTAAIEAYSVPRDETVVGMLGDFDEEPEQFGILFGLRSVYFNNPFGQSPGAHAVEYSAFPSLDLGIYEETQVHVGGDVYLTTPAPDLVAWLFAGLGDLLAHRNQALEARAEPLRPEEADDFAQQVINGWRLHHEELQRQQLDWADQLVGFLKEHGDVPGLYVAPDISDRKLSNAVARYEIPEGEAILGLIDETVAGSAKNGLVFGVGGLYFHNQWGSVSPGANRIPYSDLGSGRVEQTDKYEVQLGPGPSYNTLNAEPVSELLTDLQALLADRAG